MTTLSLNICPINQFNFPFKKENRDSGLILVKVKNSIKFTFYALATFNNVLDVREHYSMYLFKFLANFNQRVHLCKSS